MLRLLASLLVVTAAAGKNATASRDSSACHIVPQQTRNCLSDNQAIRRCLANKLIHVYGNSVSRHWAYTLAYILEGGTRAFKQNREGGYKPEHVEEALKHLPDRQSEKLYCAHGSGKKRCQWFVGDGTHMVFVWQQHVWEEVFEDQFTKPCDPTSDNPREMNRVKDGYCRPDVAIISVASDDVYHAGSDCPAQCPDQSEKSYCAKFGKNHSVAERYEYWHGRITDQGPKLVRMLRDVASSGASVYYRTSTPNCGFSAESHGYESPDEPLWTSEPSAECMARPRPKNQNAAQWAVQCRGLSIENANLRSGGEFMTALLCAEGDSPAARVGVVPAYEWVADGSKDPLQPSSCKDYDDAVHHSRLQFDHLNAWLCDVCDADLKSSSAEANSKQYKSARITATAAPAARALAQA